MFKSQLLSGSLSIENPDYKFFDFASSSLTRLNKEIVEIFFKGIPISTFSAWIEKYPLNTFHKYSKVSPRLG